MSQLDPVLLRDTRAYLLLRLGRCAEVDRCMERLVNAATQLPSQVDPADSRQRWFHRARRMSAGFGEITRKLVDDLPWVPLPEGVEALAATLRRELTPIAREVLALRFSLGFGEPSIADLINQSVAEVELTLGAAIGVARLTIGSFHAPLGLLLGAVFRLDPDRVPSIGDQSIAAVGEVIDGRYRIEGLLGRGASAQVFLASDLQIRGHQVALKLMRQPVSDAMVADAIRRELEILASLWHPSVVQLRGNGQHRGRIYLTMPFLHGETLANRIARHPAGLGRAEAQRIFVALAGALSAIHGVGVRHQDLKPQNIYLATIPGSLEEHPLILDLGVAARHDELVAAGTPPYMAPEVAQDFLASTYAGDAARVSEKADIYSLASCLVEALAPDIFVGLVGAGASPDALFERRASGVLPRWTDHRLSDLASSLSRWMAAAPEARPDAVVFARELSVLTAHPGRRAARRWFARRVRGPSAAVAGAVGDWWGRVVPGPLGASPGSHPSTPEASTSTVV